MVALEHPLRAQRRVESAIVMQSLVRRFLGRTLVLQVSVETDASMLLSRAAAVDKHCRADCWTPREDGW